MKDKDFKNLIESIKQVKAIRNGTLKPGRVVKFSPSEVKKIRAKSKNFLFNSKEAKYLWNKSDDAIRTTRMLNEIYSNVPKKLDVVVHVLEFHKLICSSDTEKRKILKWLNSTK